jgi:hypothetical protein
MLHYPIIMRRATYKVILTSVGAFALLIMVSGCAVFSGQPEVPLNDEAAQWVLESLRQREARIRSVKGLFRASVSGSSVIPISQNLDGVLFYERPYWVHLRGFARVGGTIFEFQRDGDYYELNIPSSGKAVQGQITALDDSQEVSRVVELSIRTMDAILGKFDDADGSKVLLYQDGESFRLDIQSMLERGGENNDPLMTRVWVNRDTFDVIQVEYLNKDEEAIMVVECSDFRAVKSKDPSISSPIRLPFHIRTEDLRSQGGSMTLTFQELAANAESAPI